MRNPTATLFLGACVLGWLLSASHAEQPVYRSHPPMRPLPVPASRLLTAGPARFVDPAKGSDQADSTQPGGNRWTCVCNRRARPSMPAWKYRRNGRTRYATRIRAGRTLVPSPWESNPGSVDRWPVHHVRFAGGPVGSYCVRPFKRHSGKDSWPPS